MIRVRAAKPENAVIRFYLKVNEGRPEKGLRRLRCVLLPILRQEAREFSPSKSSHSMERFVATQEVKTSWKLEEVPDKLNLDKLE